MHSPAELLNIFEQSLHQEKIRREPQNLYEPVNYILSLGGKRIRPVMALMACEMFGGEKEKCLPAALGIEMFHNFSLVHDDIMDRAPIRRGKPTVHEKWNPNAAILSGDTMLVLAYEYFMQLEEPLILPVTRIFSRTAREVCEGQQYDMDFEKQSQVTIGDYLEMIRLKTAVLIGASLQIGGMVAGANAGDLNMIYDFGLNAGMAFQLMDDLLDAYGDEKEFGKRQYGDIHANKKTFLYLKALELADGEQREWLLSHYSGHSDDPSKKVIGVMGIFTALNVKKHTEDMIRHYHELALENFSRIQASDSRKKVILDFTGHLMARKY